MRTVNVKRFFRAAAALFTVAVFASCSNEDEPLPEVIESEVLDSGLDDQVVSKPVEGVSGTNGVELSYQSWIRVKGETRAFFDDKVTVMLTDVFNCVDSTVNVGSFELSGYRTSVSYKKRGERQEDFVQVSDSIMAYTVSFDQFSFDYELLFERPYMMTVIPGRRCLIIESVPLRTTAMFCPIWSLRLKRMNMTSSWFICANVSVIQSALISMVGIIC